MDQWQRNYKDQVTFLCVSCAGPGLALEMSKEMQLRACTNGFIERRDLMPKWGQLGCSGFIVLDKDLNVVCEKSKAFLEVRDRAFEDVEKILKGLLAKKRDRSADEEDDERRKKAEKHPCYRDDWQPAETKVKTVKTVGNEDIDAQHRACEQCLSDLAEAPHGKSLKLLKRALENHFSYEEKILRVLTQKSVDEKEDSSFSASESKLTSHLADHKRVLKSIDDAMKKVRDTISSLSVKGLKQQIDLSGRDYKDCVTKSDLRERAFETMRVEDSVVNACLNWWKEHERYDQSYRMDLVVKKKACSKQGG